MNFRKEKKMEWKKEGVSVPLRNVNVHFWSDTIKSLDALDVSTERFSRKKRNPE
jgi:hypothetical protein